MATEKKKNNSRSKNKMFKSRRTSFQEIAVLRVKNLFEEAEKIFNEDSSLADRYVFLAKKMAMKYKISFTKGQKLKACKNCGKYLVQGVNSRIRLSKGNLVILCQNCKYIRRLKYK